MREEGSAEWSKVSLSQLQKGGGTWAFGGQREPHCLSWPHFRATRPLGLISGFDACSSARLCLACEIVLVGMFEARLSVLLWGVMTC